MTANESAAFEEIEQVVPIGLAGRWMRTFLRLGRAVVPARLLHDLASARQARTTYGVSGAGLTAAVIDTGVNRHHVDFEDRDLLDGINVLNEHDITPDITSDFTDYIGHGTWVAGILGANGIHTGVAPQASLFAIKAWRPGTGQSLPIATALEWIVEQHRACGITVVALAWRAPPLQPDDAENLRAHQRIQAAIRNLHDLGIPVVAAAGNDYAASAPEQRMVFPASLPRSLSVGAVFAKDLRPFTDDRSRIRYLRARRGAIAPYSNRLHPSRNEPGATDLFAPGSGLVSTGIHGYYSASRIDHGTSGAVPFVAGAILLLQELAKERLNRLPTIAELRGWLHEGGDRVDDDCDSCFQFLGGTDEYVEPTWLSYRRLNVADALEQVVRAAKRAAQGTRAGAQAPQ